MKRVMLFPILLLCAACGAQDSMTAPSAAVVEAQAVVGPPPSIGPVAPALPVSVEGPSGCVEASSLPTVVVWLMHHLPAGAVLTKAYHWDDSVNCDSTEQQQRTENEHLRIILDPLDLTSARVEFDRDVELCRGRQQPDVSVDGLTQIGMVIKRSNGKVCTTATPPPPSPPPVAPPPVHPPPVPPVVPPIPPVPPTPPPPPPPVTQTSIWGFHTTCTMQGTEIVIEAMINVASVTVKKTTAPTAEVTFTSSGTKTVTWAPGTYTVTATSTPGSAFPNTLTQVTVPIVFKDCSPPKTCPELNPPGHDAPTFTQTTVQQDIRGQVNVRNAGTWKLVMYASHPGHPDYVKDTDTVTLACGEHQTLHVSYAWTNHPSHDWWVKLFRNDVEVATSPKVTK